MLFLYNQECVWYQGTVGGNKTKMQGGKAGGGLVCDLLTSYMYQGGVIVNNVISENQIPALTSQLV